MSRAKNAVEKKSWNGPCLLEKRMDAQYGRNYDVEASSFVTLLKEALTLEKGYGSSWFPVDSERTHKIMERCRDEQAWKSLSEHFSKAVESGDGNFFRKLAAVIECQKKPVDERRALFGMMVQVFNDAKNPLPEVSEIVRFFRGQGLPTSFTQVKRYLAQYEATASPAKIGRPKKAARKA